MRFTITPESGEPLVLTDTTNGQTLGWWLVDSVVEGWFGTPGPRESVLACASHDGDMFPSTLTQGPRIVTIYGTLECPSAVSAAQATSQINGLFGQKLKVTGEDASGPKHAWGYLSDDPQPKHYPGQRIVKFSLVITCPYPVKSGDDVEYSVSNGGVYVENEGNAPAWPKLSVTGNVTSASISFNGHTVSWQGSSNGLLIDLFKDLSQFSGITADDAFSIPPGRHWVSVSASGGNASVVLASAWR